MHTSKVLCCTAQRDQGSELESQPVSEVLVTVKVSIYADHDKHILLRLPESQRRGQARSGVPVMA